MTPTWHSERFPATGGIGGSGAGNVLGRPQLSRRAVLIRESIQNSSDAGRDSRKPISYSVTGRALGGTERDALRGALVGPKSPTAGGVSLLESLRKSHVNILTISDRGTRGLGGPTRADRIETGAGRRDFVAFVRNIGDPSGKHGNGGTYGYGKGCFYGFSHARTVLIDTQTLRGGAQARRLIVAALGKEYEAPLAGVPTPFTGRHWWGEVRDGVPEPLIGATAAELAESMGLPGFQTGETGTSITIIDPAFEVEPVAELELMAEALMWWAWPLLIPDEKGVTRVSASMAWEGAPVAVPNPTKHPVLKTFVTAYQRATSAEAVDIKTPAYKIGRMGKLGFQRGLDKDGGPEPSVENPLRETVRHVALMRLPRLVVKYEQVSALPVDRVHFAGVFLAESIHDGAFALAEPPTHDDWVYVQLQGVDRTVVRTALDHISSEMKKRGGVGAEPGGRTADGAPMGAASALFAGLVGTGSGARAADDGRDAADGAGGGGGTSGVAAGGSKPKVNLESADFATDGSGRLIARMVITGTSAGGGELQVQVGVGLDGGRETDPPLGAAVPILESLIAPDGTRHQGSRLQLPAGSDGEWRVVIIPADDTVTEVAARIIR